MVETKRRVAWSRLGLLAACAFTCAVSIPVHALKYQPQSPSKSQTPIVVQPGAPGQPTKQLPSSTRGKLPPPSAKDVEFMQGMIMHHAQAVEMTALIDSHTENKEIRKLGARISRSQSDEMKFMKRWLESRGQSTSHEAASQTAARDGASKPPSHQGHNTHPTTSHDAHMLMPGMLTAHQMKALREAKGEEFDRLFLEGMIQHHNGALVMVKELFDTAGAGQDPELFTFATDVDSGQRAEIGRMQKMLEDKDGRQD